MEGTNQGSVVTELVKNPVESNNEMNAMLRMVSINANLNINHLQ